MSFFKRIDEKHANGIIWIYLNLYLISFGLCSLTCFGFLEHWGYLSLKLK
ncbi:hypothetical protein Syun_018320 [Stephania yunnanensis]|uniref:Uncharacterized protein n=1 Tax=Stephania yunnanensis TaxID=152371 RepID=A0AAP0IS09_9MAGN